MSTTNRPSTSLKKKRKQWLQALRGRDRHTIVRQLTNMSWDIASFRIINEARRVAPPGPSGGVQINGMLHSLLDRCFFSQLMISIRRLTESYKIDDARRGVYSLTSLLKDMGKHWHLLTRENILRAEGWPCDCEGNRPVVSSIAMAMAGTGREPAMVLPDLMQTTASFGMRPSTVW